MEESKTSVERYQCPFYGFYFVQKVGGVTPNWDKCHFNTDEVKATIEKILDSCKVAPREFWPEGESSWDGMPMGEWKDRVMADSSR